mmetsp:Transcript_4621/g.11416  ORF Transcript_4621/g.11416 Transcript_4621/m.11416 type:complete len:239 (-) Transcript_4621:2621-3337(-)
MSVSCLMSPSVRGAETVIKTHTDEKLTGHIESVLEVHQLGGESFGFIELWVQRESTLTFLQNTFRNALDRLHVKTELFLARLAREHFLLTQRLVDHTEIRHHVIMLLVHLQQSSEDHHDILRMFSRKKDLDLGYVRSELALQIKRELVTDQTKQLVGPLGGQKQTHVHLSKRWPLGVVDRRLVAQYVLPQVIGGVTADRRIENQQGFAPGAQQTTIPGILRARQQVAVESTPETCGTR